MNEFAERLNELITKKNLTDLQVARLCKVALGTVRHWKTGVGAPHPFGRESVFRVLEAYNEETK